MSKNSPHKCICRSECDFIPQHSLGLSGGHSITPPTLIHKQQECSSLWAHSSPDSSHAKHPHYLRSICVQTSRLRSGTCAPNLELSHRMMPFSMSYACRSSLWKRTAEHRFTSRHCNPNCLSSLQILYLIHEISNSSQIMKTVAHS